MGLEAVADNVWRASVLMRKKPTVSVAMQKEHWHYQPLVVGALRAGWALYRIEDGGYGKKPCDIGGLSADGRGVILEVKVVERRLLYSDVLPWKQFEPHQIGWLKVAKQRGGLPVVALFSKEDMGMRLYHVQEDDKPAGHLCNVQLALDHLSDGTAYWGLADQWAEIAEGTIDRAN